MATATQQRSDLPPSRSPCPVLNSLSTSSLLPPSGRSIPASRFHSALTTIGIAPDLRHLLIDATFLERHKPYPTFVSKLLNPLAYLFRAFGARNIGQVNASGVPVIDLEQVGIHGVIEHDVSLSRRDEAQGDNHSPQANLISQLVEAGTGEYITVNDFAALRRKRLEQQQQRDNGKLVFTEKENMVACSEVALILATFGDGERVKRSVVSSLWDEERIPAGWRKREGFWGVGILEMKNGADRVKALVGFARKKELRFRLSCLLTLREGCMIQWLYAR